MVTSISNAKIQIQFEKLSTKNEQIKTKEDTEVKGKLDPHIQMINVCRLT